MVWLDDNKGRQVSVTLYWLLFKMTSTFLHAQFWASQRRITRQHYWSAVWASVLVVYKNFSIVQYISWNMKMFVATKRLINRQILLWLLTPYDSDKNKLKETLAHIMRIVLYNLVPIIAPVPTAQHPCDQSNFRPVSLLSYPTSRELQLRTRIKQFCSKANISG